MPNETLWFNTDGTLSLGLDDGTGEHTLRLCDVCPCGFGFNIHVQYQPVHVPGHPCPLQVHQCDHAAFDILANGVNIGFANLNNLSDGGFRESWIFISIAQAEALAALDPFNYITLEFQCIYNAGNPSPDGSITCHQGVGWVTVTKNTGDVLSDSCPIGIIVSFPYV